MDNTHYFKQLLVKLFHPQRWCYSKTIRGLWTPQPRRACCKIPSDIGVRIRRVAGGEETVPCGCNSVSTPGLVRTSTWRWLKPVQRACVEENPITPRGAYRFYFLDHGAYSWQAIAMSRPVHWELCLHHTLISFLTWTIYLRQGHSERGSVESEPPPPT